MDGKPTPRGRVRVAGIVVAATLALCGVAAAPASAGAGPTIISLSPSTSGVAGSMPITITGTGFASGDTVEFGPGTGGTPVLAHVQSVSSTQIIASIPPDPHSPRTATPDIFTIHVRTSGCAVQGGSCEVSNLGGSRIIFSYTGPWPSSPSISGISPSTGTPRGGTPLTISGSSFTPDATVVFDGLPSGSVTVAAPQVTVNPDGLSLTVPTPDDSSDPHLPDPNVLIHVHTAGGDSGKTHYTYRWDKGPAPSITGIQPGDGDPKGSQQITINGTGLGGADGKPTASLSYQVPLNPQTCGSCSGKTAALTGVTVNKGGTQITATTPDVSDAAVPQDVTLTVTTTAGIATTKFHLDNCNGPHDLNPVHALLNSMFSIPQCTGTNKGFVDWLLQEPNVPGNGASTSGSPSSANQPNPTVVQQLESVTEGIALGLLGLVFTISVLRFSVGGIASGNPGAVIQGITHPVGAAIMILAWPQIFAAGALLTDTVTNAIVSGPVNPDAVANLFMAAMLTLAGGVAAFGGGIGIIIGILFVLAGVSLFFALIALKLSLLALMTVVYVAMPLIVMISRIPSCEWLFTAGMRAWVVGLVWPIGWALIIECAGAVFVDGLGGR